MSDRKKDNTKRIQEEELEYRRKIRRQEQERTKHQGLGKTGSNFLSANSFRSIHQPKISQLPSRHTSPLDLSKLRDPSLRNRRIG